MMTNEELARRAAKSCFRENEPNILEMVLRKIVIPKDWVGSYSCAQLSYWVQDAIENNKEQSQIQELLDWINSAKNLNRELPYIENETELIEHVKKLHREISRLKEALDVIVTEANSCL